MHMLSKEELQKMAAQSPPCAYELFPGMRDRAWCYKETPDHKVAPITLVCQCNDPDLKESDPFTDEGSLRDVRVRMNSQKKVSIFVREDERLVDKRIVWGECPTCKRVFWFFDPC